MFRYLCPAAISKTHSCPHFLMKPQTINGIFLFENNFSISDLDSISVI